MLGEKIYAWTGQVQGQRILPADAEGRRMEITFGGKLHIEASKPPVKPMWLQPVN